MEREEQKNLLDLPEELILKIFSECQCIKPLLETSRKCCDIIKTNKCLYKRLIWNLNLISESRNFSVKYGRTKGFIINEQLFSGKLTIPLRKHSKGLVEKFSQFIEMAKIEARLEDLEVAHELSMILQKMENLEELEYTVTGGHLAPSFTTWNLDQIEMPTFSNLKILKLHSYYNYHNTYYPVTTTFDFISIFRHVSNLRELIIYDAVSFHLSHGKLVLQQKSLKKLHILVGKCNSCDFLSCFKDVQEIAGNVNFQLEELVIENQIIYLSGQKLLEFLKTQTSLKKFVIRLYYDDETAQEYLPQIYSKVFKMENLKHIEIFSPNPIQLDDFTPNPSVHTFLLSQDLGDGFNANFHTMFPNLENLEVIRDLSDKIKMDHVKNIDILEC